MVNTHDAVNAFAAEVETTIAGVLPQLDDGSGLVSAVEAKAHFVIEPATPHALALRVDEEQVGTLRFFYFLVVDEESGSITVTKSQMSLQPRGSAEPVLRLEFDPGQNPSSHWHLHAENGALSVWLSRAHPEHRREFRRWAVQSIHLPTGGERWRPGMADFLEMAVRDFGVDCRQDWRRSIQQSRTNWRHAQEQSSIAANLAVAADVLRDHGYRVTPPSTGDQSQVEPGD